MLYRRVEFLMLTVIALLTSAAAAQEGGCWICDYCQIMTEEECLSWDGVYCGDGSDCNDCEPGPCDTVPDSDVCWVTPWDEYGRILVSPGSQSSVDEVTVHVRGTSGAPIAQSLVEIDVSECPSLCVDIGDAGLGGVTGADGDVTLNPRVGGCAECQALVRASGVTIATYQFVVSPDSDADGRVSSVDFSFFAAAFHGNADECADYNGDDVVSGVDFSLFGSAFVSGDANETECH